VSMMATALACMKLSTTLIRDLTAQQGGAHKNG
jgi:hypothetical protein